MSLWLDFLLLAVRSMQMRPRRAILAIVGLAIGVAAVVAAQLLTQGLGATISRQFDALGGDVVAVTPYTRIADVLKGRSNGLQAADVATISTTEGIASVTPVMRLSPLFGSELGFKSASTSSTILATTPSYAVVYRSGLLHGRFISMFDQLEGRQVCVVGESVRKELQLPTNPVGEFITIGKQWFRVVGVIAPKGALFGIDQDNYVLTPLRLDFASQGHRELDLSVYASVTSASDPEEVADRLRAKLQRARADSRATDLDTFRVQSASEVSAMVRDTQDRITSIVVSVVAISLLVAGVGVMNMSYTSVDDRVGEIGILKAIGATNAQVLCLFVFEAIVLSLAGAVVGAIAGTSLGYLGLAILDVGEMPRLSISTICLPTIFCTLLGIIFSIVPASRAASLNPVKALTQQES